MDGLFPIHTERLVLRERSASDEADIHTYASDPEVARSTVWGPNRPEMTRTFLMQTLEAQKQSPRHTLEVAIELKSENRMIGGTLPAAATRRIGMRTARPTLAGCSTEASGDTATWA
jgi:RimJ/RimL family protein N-acetyltransferase